MRASHPLIQLLGERNARVEDAALIIAQEANPHLDPAWVYSQLAFWASAVAMKRRRNPNPEDDAKTLASFLFGELGFEGDQHDYYDPKNSYIDQVLERRKGIPLSLSVVTMAVGRRAGMKVEGVGFPGHFLVRVGGADGVYQDPFRRGELLDATAIRQLAAKHLGAEMALHPKYLEPVDTVTMTIRMLANLKRAHRRRGDNARAMLACDRLVDLTDAPEHRRDRGLLAHSLRSYGAASEDLAAYLAARPNAKDAPVITETLREARAHPDLTLH